MKKRFNPRRPLLFLGMAGIVLILNLTPAFSQCQGEFSYQSFAPEEASPGGKIRISIRNPQAGLYTVKVYRMDGKISQVDERTVSPSDQIIFDGLVPSKYFVKIEWSGSCRKVLGGLEGIIITPKDQKR